MAINQTSKPGPSSQLDRESDGQKAIREIDPNVIRFISAGEKISNIETALKELIENSIDAGSSMIEVRLKNFGIDTIEVEDNGTGIDEKDFDTLAHRYHTSKINDFKNLQESLQTFGFRGEALSCLCKVAHVTIITKNENSPTGTKLCYTDGSLTSREPIARKNGTTVIIKNLFHSMPVRRKDLECNAKRQYEKLFKLIYEQVLVRPHIKFSLFKKLAVKKIQEFVHGGTTLEGCIITIYGTKVMESLMPIERAIYGELQNDRNISGRVDRKDSKGNTCQPVVPVEPTVAHSREFFRRDRKSKFSREKPEYLISGYISKVGQGRHSTDCQFMYVNKKPCEIPKVAKIINEIYRNYSNQIPFFCLFIDVQNWAADFNVPRKREVILQDENKLVAIVEESLEKMFSPCKPAKQKLCPVAQIPCIDRSSEKFEGISANHDALVAGKFKRDDSINQSTPCKPAEQKVCLAAQKPCIDRSLEKYEGNSAYTGISAPVFENFKTADLLLQSTPRQTAIQKVCPVAQVPRQDRSPDENEGISANQGAPVSENFRTADLLLQSTPRQTAIQKVCSVAQIPRQDRSPDENVGISANQGAPVSENFRTADSINQSIPSPPIKQRVCPDAQIPRLDRSPNNFEDISTNQDTPAAKRLKRAEFVDQSTTICAQPHSNMSPAKLQSIECSFNQNVITTGDGQIGVEIENSQDLAKALERERIQRQQDSRHQEYNFAIHPKFNDVAVQEMKLNLSKNSFEEMQIIGQFNKGFIITRLGDHLFIIDQHATDERANYEEQLDISPLQRQTMVHPKPLYLNSMQESIIRNNLDAFKKRGIEFLVDDSKPPGYRVMLSATSVCKKQGIDAHLGREDIEELIDVINESPNLLASYTLKKVQSVAAMRACRKSVMIGSVLTWQQMKSIVARMSKLKNPWVCAHDRPTIRHLMNTSW